VSDDAIEPTPTVTPVPVPIAPTDSAAPEPADAAVPPRPRPEFLSGSAIAASLIVSGVAFVTVLVLSIVATLLLGLAALDHGFSDVTSQAGIPSTGLTQDPASVQVLPAFLLIGSLALLGNVSASIVTDAGSISGSVTFTPLVLTLLIAFITAWAGYAIERRTPTTTRGGLLLLSLASGLALAIVWTALTALAHPGISVAHTTISLSGGNVRTFFGALILISSATLLGRWVARREPTAAFTRFPRELGARMAIAPRAIGDAWTALVTGGLIFGAVSLVGGIIYVGTQVGWGSAFGGLLLWWGPAALFGSVIGQFGAIWALAGGGGGGPTTGAVSTFVSVLDSGFFWLLVLAAVVTAVVAGLRISRRRAWSERRSFGSAWQLPVIAAAAWLILPWLVGLIAASGSGKVAILGSGTLSVFVAVAPWFFLIGGIWGLAVEALARFAAPVLSTTYPLAARVAGPRASTLDSPAPLTAGGRRGLAIGLGAAAIVIVVVAIGGIGISVLSSTVFGPSATAGSYLNQIASGDLSGASKTVRLTGSNGAALSADKVLPAKDRISQVHVDRTTTSGNHATATVSYALGGKRHTAQIELESRGAKLLVFQDWHVVSPLTASIDVVLDGAKQADVNGVPVALKNGTATVAVYPGRYTVTLPGSSKWFAAKPATVVALAGSFGTAQLDAKPTAALTAEVTRQVKTLIDGCAAQATPAPTGCPFQTYTFGDVSGFTWTIKSYPDVKLSSDGTTFDLSGGDIVADYTESDFGFSETQSDDEDVFAYGDIKISGDTVTLAYTD
jgi:hypothetical protein